MNEFKAYTKTSNFITIVIKFSSLPDIKDTLYIVDIKGVSIINYYKKIIVVKYVKMSSIAINSIL